MADEQKFLVFRVYSKKEREDPNTRSLFYGWSDSKSVLKCFFDQRDKKKYRVVKVDDDDIAKNFDEDVIDDSTKIDFVKLKSATTLEEVCLFMTKNELIEAEIRIQRLFEDLSSLENKKYINMILNLKPKYAEALYYLGYRPPEIDIMFPSADDMDNYSNESETEYLLTTAYEELIMRDNYGGYAHKVLGPDVLSDPFRRMIYSVESFIKVLRDDM